MIRNFAKDANLKMADQTITVDVAGQVSASPVYYDHGEDWQSKGLVTLYIQAGVNSAAPGVLYKFKHEFSAATNFATVVGLTETTIDEVNHTANDVYALTSEVKSRYSRLYTDVTGAANMPIVAYLADQFNR